MPALAMNVEDTKLLILRRLDELRERDDPSGRPSPGPAEQAGQATLAPTIERRRRTNKRSWRRQRQPDISGEVAQRLDALEDRLIAVERSFIAAPKARRQQPAQSELARLQGQANQDNQAKTETAEKAAAVSEQAASDAQNESKKGEFNFGGVPYRLTGSAADGLMTDVLQMLSSNQKTGCFSFFPDESDHRFDLYFKDGEVVHAVAGDLEGEAAFFAVLVTGHERGHYGFIEGAGKDVEQSIEAKTQFLILEALRRIDEERHGSGAGGEGE